MRDSETRVLLYRHRRLGGWQMQRSKVWRWNVEKKETEREKSVCAVRATHQFTAAHWALCSWWICRNVQRRGRSLGGGKQTKCATLMNVKAFPSRRQQICSWALSAGQMIDPASKSKQKDGRIFFFSRSLRHTATAKTNNQSKNGRIIFFFFFLSRLSTASRPDGCAQTWKEIVVFTETDVVLFWMQQSGYRRYTGKRKWNGRDAVNGRRKRLRRSGPRLLNSPPETYPVYTHTVERERNTTWTKWVGET